MKEKQKTAEKKEKWDVILYGGTKCGERRDPEEENISIYSLSSGLF